MSASPSLSLGRSYAAVGESSKTPFKQKEIEKRLNDIREGRFEESQSGRLLRVF